ncbi:outer membrane protein assembly factor BamD [Spartinivicinus poritis]|uniref:Outer membrane protein assembly factor BamD n=1 Tax=Spartinivicinus poritis TaxID=2994640 RepID=A0ABT5U4Q8_9GAMM|nr:outer membrane protein assembly factor BamD [Spartinivicinus sp. A2-2]MDE1460527.1 outer membrane protein assembly factor BamD [Spartinivicinus sp. A2-2]
MVRMIKYSLLLSLALLLSACASDSKQDIPEELTEAELYQQAQLALDTSNYSDAIDKLRALESRFPFGSYAEQAQLDLIFAYYKNQEQEAAKASAERFIRLHPQHENVDYAYYMKGLASYTADIGFIERFVEIDMSKRDPGQARDSFNEFAELLKRFPNSRYAPDAQKRMIHLRNQLSRYEIHVANYYMKRKAYVAAANRARFVVENMQETPAIPDALAILVEANQHLGLTKASDNALKVLRTNYPKHPALDSQGNFVQYKVYYDVDPSVWNIVSFGLLDDPEESIPPSRQQVVKPAEEKEQEKTEDEQTSGDRSWLNIMTFGVVGDDGSEQSEEEPKTTE